jgi:hypothetical protein
VLRDAPIGQDIAGQERETVSGMSLSNKEIALETLFECWLVLSSLPMLVLCKTRKRTIRSTRFLHFHFRSANRVWTGKSFRNALFVSLCLARPKRNFLFLFASLLHNACPPKGNQQRLINRFLLALFAESQLLHRFCVGDRFYLHDDKILCEYDYSERLATLGLVTSSASAAASGLPSQPTGNCASAAMNVNHQLRGNAIATATSHISSAQ